VVSVSEELDYPKDETVKFILMVCGSHSGEVATFVECNSEFSPKV